ncbi:YlmH/Sll1252 family protein [Clostridium isatidis]|uniref:YlmH/Sll1252 family protein n=1 Tax=Clostridium isatidis TaxID=182773 RepID=UPI003AAB08B4
MIKKELLLNTFSEEDINLAIKVYEKYKLAYEKGIPVYVNEFIPPSIWYFFLENSKKSEVMVETSGVFEEAERRIIFFNNFYDSSYPIKVLEIRNKSNFSKLEHKDYLGAVLSLGIERSKLGDVVILENAAYFPVLEEISEYIINNLSIIGRSPVEIKEIKDFNILPEIRFEETIINLASMRLDNIVSKLANISRAKASQIIDNGKVLINYARAKDKSQEIKKNDRITIRGIGKFAIGDLVETTRSAKVKVIIKKYK